MNCPACQAKTSEIIAYGLKLDVCTESCGGVWFDAGELDQVDQVKERIDSRIIRPLTNQKVVVDRNRIRPCPCCSQTSLERQIEDSVSDLEVDVCPKCEGVFLDFGELNTLRTNNSKREEAAEVIDGYLNRYAKNPKAIPKGLRAVCELLFR